VDDDVRVRESLVSLLESAGFVPFVFATAEELLRSGALAQACCLISDVRMPGMTGLELQMGIRTYRRSLPVIFITAHGDVDIRRRALAGGASAFLYKPFDGAELLRLIEDAVKDPSKD
jgi:FixJ family two-component response regulator